MTDNDSNTVDNMKKKSPALAVILSGVIPGLGHFYLGKFISGIVYFIITIVLFVESFKSTLSQSWNGSHNSDNISFITIAQIANGIIVAFIAYIDARNINIKYSLLHAKCPYCSEIVKSEAIVCKHCHKEIKCTNNIPDMA